MKPTRSPLGQSQIQTQIHQHHVITIFENLQIQKLQAQKYGFRVLYLRFFLRQNSYLFCFELFFCRPTSGGCGSRRQTPNEASQRREGRKTHHHTAPSSFSFPPRGWALSSSSYPDRDASGADYGLPAPARMSRKHVSGIKAASRM
jgi:hypothetical protein